MRRAGFRSRAAGGRSSNSVSLAVAPGELVALCGPNGAGKSSLLAVLAGELRPGAGEARLDGRPLATLGPGALARERAILEQAPTLAAPFTVSELVGLGMSLVARADVDEAAIRSRALAAAGVADLAGRGADRLSGGERARAHLARVLAQLWAGRAAGGGRYLLLDEPTASLDIAHQLVVMRAARAEVRAGAGVLCVLHDLNLAAGFADRAALMQAGRIVAAGPPVEVLRADRLSEVYGSPLAVEQTTRGLRVFSEF
ncbi:MAG: heme ABC transporter ATP-binding protein [Amaricoccus sp.]|uniref:heme ABC transporter ATP-binding protein n=1 Tax=Amaricoccus sp. TaxID=1872485 RepID=UPI0039E7264B